MKMALFLALMTVCAFTAASFQLNTDHLNTPNAIMSENRRGRRQVLERVNASQTEAQPSEQELNSLAETVTKPSSSNYTTVLKSATILNQTDVEYEDYDDDGETLIFTKRSSTTATITNPTTQLPTRALSTNSSTAPQQQNKSFNLTTAYRESTTGLFSNRTTQFFATTRQNVSSNTTVSYKNVTKTNTSLTKPFTGTPKYMTMQKDDGDHDLDTDDFITKPKLVTNATDPEPETDFFEKFLIGLLVAVGSVCAVVAIFFTVRGLMRYFRRKTYNTIELSDFKGYYD
jgi:hypothetical protein